MIIKSLGNLDLDLLVYGEIAEWETSAPASLGPLDPGESAALPVQVTIPAGVEDGEQSVATLTATSVGDPAVSDSAVLTTTAQVTYGVSLSPAMLEGSGVPGSTAAYTLTLIVRVQGTR